MKIHKGDVFLVNLGAIVGSEQGGRRPAVIIQNDIGNTFSSTTIIALITSKKKRSPTAKPYHVLISNSNFLKKKSYIMTEQLRTISKDRLGKFLGCLSNSEMQNLNYALKISLELNRKGKNI